MNKADKTSKTSKSFRGVIGLGLLTMLMIATVIPAVAVEKPEINHKINKTATSLLIQGKTAYESGNFNQAKEDWTLAEAQFRTQGDRLNQALSLNYLSLADQELGQWQEAEQHIDQSLQLLKSSSSPEVLAQALNTQGSLQLSQGNGTEALASWSAAEKIYRQGSDAMGIMGSQLNQAQALQQLGLYRRSQKLLEQLATELEQESDPQLRVMGLRSLGNALQVAGNLEQSQQVLTESLKLAQKSKLEAETSAILFSLGNTARSLKHYEEAIAFYAQAAEKTTDLISRVEAQLNQLSLLSLLNKPQAVQELLPQIQSNLSNLSPSRRSMYAKVNLAKNLIDQSADASNKYLPYSQTLLEQTIAEAQKIQDVRAQSYGLGTLGHLAEQRQQLDLAKQQTEQALVLATTIDAEDITYQWQWQLGRIFQQQGDIQSAIAAESNAVQSLEKIRGDLVATNLDAQYSFRESVEPIYRDLVALLVSSAPNQENLSQARSVIESLQLAELENYFREACIDAKPKQIDQVDTQAAVVYPIILPDRLAVIVSLPGKPLSYYEHRVAQADAEQVISKLYQSLNPAFSNKRRLQLSQQVYNWLIQPAEAALTSSKIETLVFVLDGSLRNLPMAALYDGKQYLVEKYNLALTPGMQLLDPTALNKQKLQAVVAGVSESNEGFSALPGVKTEVEDISQTFPSQTLLNQEFTSQNFQEQLKHSPSPLIHLATHGQFSSNPEETFIVTWGDRIKVKDLEHILQAREESIDSKPIELLVLSACQTAEGDKRAALGIAGIAVRSGARSTLATLWSVEDQSTVKLMNQFYRQLATQDSVTKAKALREAQISLMHSENYHHPYYWAPFILVGNWL
jgi:CHAT domain-containing protein/predicted negative regulator of RcsB-dependent stress response